MQNIVRKFVCAIFFLIVLTACSSTQKIVIKDEAPWYFPTVLEVDVGATVTWDNSMAAVVHPVNILKGPKEFSSGHFTKTWHYTFSKPGIYHYFCPIHPYMQGFIGVGEKVPSEMIPKWAKAWPPESARMLVPGGLPSELGVGEVWLDAQFQMVEGKKKPGTVIVVDASTWKVKKIIDDDKLNNPHNLWLSEDGNSILQTNWFGQDMSVIDRYTGFVVKQVFVGESPAHVMTARGKVYVTVQGADGIAVLDGESLKVEKTLRTVEGEHTHGHGVESSHEEEKTSEYLGRGPHGHWMSDDGKIMVVAHTEGSSMSVWDLEQEEKLWEYSVDPLPLMAGISSDGRFAWIASHLTGEFYAFDVGAKKILKQFVVGKGPVQSIPSPNGEYVFVALSGDGAVAVLNGTTFERIKVLSSGAGAHGVSFGPKQGGGWFAYVSHKFVPWITVINVDTLEVAGFVPVPKDSLGGQGILAVYDEA